MPALRDMKPENAIAPTDLVRRRGRRREHLVDLGESHPDIVTVSLCGQSFLDPVFSTAYNAEQVTCDDCLVAAISRGGAKR